MRQNHISILGAGLIGSLLSIYLKRKGYAVEVFEKRPDGRLVDLDSGRSINMALSDRGWRALYELGIADEVKQYCIPMKGRMIHPEAGQTNFQPYGKDDQAIYSIPRGKFNQLLVSKAEAEGVQFHFESKCEEIDIDQRIMHFADGRKLHSDVIIGSDGAYSALRRAMQLTDRFDYKQEFINSGYKELTIPATASGDYALDPHALHIWPRGSYMLIALPNLDKSFTCTLFMPFEGDISFKTIHEKKIARHFFEVHFPDAISLISDFDREFYENPTSSLINIACYPWVKNRCLLIGDSSHAMVPFYGQGMNCGFEDCYVLDKLLEEYNHNWDVAFDAFQKRRKPDADAICQLAMDNFVEMRDLVANEKWVIRKKLEAKLYHFYPQEWIPLYTMVTFSDLRYSEAYALGQLQDRIMQEVMKRPLDHGKLGSY